MRTRLLHGFSATCLVVLGFSTLARAQPSDATAVVPTAPPPVVPGSSPPPEGTSAPAVVAPDAPSALAFPAPGGVEPAGADAPAAANAGVTLEDRAKQLDDEITSLLAIPEAPAAFALGISTETVAHPGDLRDAAAQLTTLLGPGGKILPGVAVEVAPFRSLYEHRTLEEWQAHATWQDHLLDGFRLSIATASDPSARGVTDAPPLLSGGARLSLLDDRDYRHRPEFISGTRAALARCFPARVTPGKGGSDFSSVVLPDCKDLPATLQALQQKYLSTGHRLELAGAVVAADRGVTSGADWRATRLWVTYEYAFGAPALGAAADVTWRDDASGEKVRDLHLGGRLSVTTGAETWSVAAAYARVAAGTEVAHDAANFGATLGFKVGGWGVVRSGLQGTRDVDAKQTDLTAIVTVAAATGETLFTKSVSYRTPGG